MNNASAILRSLIVYSICVPLAIWVGYMLTSVTEMSSRSSWIYAGIFVMLLCLPLMLRWHYILLVLCLNLSMTIFFLPGQPPVWMPVLVLSLGISVLQRTLNKGMHFISAPQITWPLICMAAVILVTAKLTGGIGLRSMGSDTMGGRKYFFILGGILTYFALTARRIPPRQAVLYLALFFLPPCVSVIGDLVAVLPSSFYFLYWFTPINGYVLGEEGNEDVGYRLSGLAAMSWGISIFMVAKYGIRGIFMSGRLWRPIIFVCIGSLVCFGGFRSVVIGLALVFFIQFYLEGLHRTKLLPRFVFAGMLVIALAVPFAQKLPFAAQRSLSFLPVKVGLAAKEEAESSAGWRVAIWNAVLPQVPGHLLLGKGYIMSQEDYQTSISGFQALSVADTGSALAGDYHSGPLSVILTFGIWGVIAFLWFLSAAIRALYDNYRYGDQELRNVNTLLLASFLGHVLTFFFIFGALQGDMLSFGSVLGLSISFNGGILRRPAADQVKAAAPAFTRPRQLAGFRR
jgi:hypothetical protein